MSRVTKIEMHFLELTKLDDVIPSHGGLENWGHGYLAICESGFGGPPLV